MRTMYPARVGQGLVASALALQAARAAATRGGIARPRRPGELPEIRLPEQRPMLVCTPRAGAGMSACNVFDLATASVIQLAAGTIVPAWPGPSGWFAGGTTIEIRLPNGHYAIAYGRDFERASADRVGQGVVDAALRLAQAEASRASAAVQKSLSEAVKKAPFDVLVKAPVDLSRASRRVEVALPRPPSREEKLARYGVIEGRAIVDRPRGIQIWSQPFNAYRPGTGIHLMERLFVMPQGTRVFLTPDPVLYDAVLNSDGNGAQFGSYRVQWSVVGDAISTAFQALGIPLSGVAWARPFSPDGGPYFRKLYPFGEGGPT